MGSKKTIKDRKCPNCNHVAFKVNGELASGIKCFGSVHTNCIFCNNPIVCGWQRSDERFIIINEEYYNKLQSDRRLKSFNLCI